MVDPDAQGDGKWFAERRFGYGAGPPIAWQGWLVLAGYLFAVLGMSALGKHLSGGWDTAAFVGVLLLTAAFIVIARRRTRGVWKWRWGGRA